MTSTFVNDLRLNEQGTGDNPGSWGTVTNTNLELIAEAFSYGTETIGNADTTITMADGSSDAARSLYLKIASSADLTTTRVITLAPNTVSKVWIIENATSGGQIITIKQGTGATINIANGQTKMIATDGAGSGGIVYDLLQDLAVPDLFVDDDLTLQSDGAIINFGADSDITLTHAADTSLTLGGAGSTTGLLINNTATDGDPFLSFALSGTQTFTMGIDDGDSDKFKIGTTAIGTNTRMTITSNGDVGIGTDSPVSNTPLTLQGGSGFTDTLKLQSVGTNIDSRINIAPTGTGTAQINNSAGTGIDFQISGTDKLTMDSSGNATFAGTITGTTATLVGANTLTLRNDTGVDANEPKLIFDNDSFSGANHANLTTGNGGLLLKIESPSTSTFQNRHQILMNGGAGDDIQFNLSTDNGSNYVNYFKIDGGNAIFNETGADKDFRVESDSNAHMFFVDASTNRVGIGTNDPTGKLDVEDNTGSLSSTKDVTAEFMRADGSNNPRLQIRHSTAGTDIHHTYSSSAANLTFSNGGVESMRIGSAGDVSIGTTVSPPVGLTITADENFHGVNLTRLTDSGNPSDDEELGSYAFNSNAEASNTLQTAEAKMVARCSQDHSGSVAGTDLEFYNKPDGTGPGSAPTQRLHLRQDGRVYTTDTISGDPHRFHVNNRVSIAPSGSKTHTITGVSQGYATLKIGYSDGNAQYAHVVVELGGSMFSSSNGYNATVVANDSSSMSVSITKNLASYVVTVNAGSNFAYGSIELSGGAFNVSTGASYAFS